jgi:hypothetical protein
VTYAILAITLVAVVVGATFVCRLRSGHRLGASLLSGQFGPSPTEQQFAAWFTEHPSRGEQRDLFVQLTRGLNCSSGAVADRLRHCIMETWRGQGARFGDLLARELDRLIVFDPPKGEEQVEQQRTACEMLVGLKVRLRALDKTEAVQSCRATSRASHTRGGSS